MKRNFLILLLAVYLCLSACSLQSTNDDISSHTPSINEIADGGESSQPDEALENSSTPSFSSSINEVIESDSNSQSSIDKTTEEEAPALSEKTQSATFLIAGNNAQGTQLKIDIPESWTVDGDKIIANEQFVARFEIVLHYDNDAVEYLQDLIAEENGNDVIIGELDILGMVVRYCETQIENADGVMQDGLRYYVCIGNQIASISLVPAPEVEINLQCKEFETYLTTLEIQP